MDGLVYFAYTEVALGLLPTVNRMYELNELTI